MRGWPSPTDINAVPSPTRADDPAPRATWRWDAVLALKPLERAKTRLAMSPDARRELAMAMAMDAATALRRSPLVSRVILVCPDPAVEVVGAAIGVHVLAGEPVGDLNTALRYGATAVMDCGLVGPRADRAVALVAADLPAASSAAFTRVLEVAEGLGGHAVLADAAGTGTTVLTFAPGAQVVPRFGPDSYRAHRGDGAEPIHHHAGSFARLRRDVDTADDLTRALDLGVGAFTSDVDLRLRTQEFAHGRETQNETSQ